MGQGWRIWDGEGQADKNQNALVQNLKKGKFWMKYFSLEYGHLNISFI